MATEHSAEPKRSLYAYSKRALERLLRDWNEKPVHADAIIKQIYEKRPKDPQTIEGIPRSLLKKLAERTHLSLPRVIRVQTSSDGTQKFLIALEDGMCIEAVRLRYAHGDTLCLSTQKGCRMGCRFCASSSLPFEGHCSVSDIVGQVVAVEEYEGIRFSNLVFMGIGEPLDNPEAVKESLAIFSDARAFPFGSKHVTVSTCGIADGIERMADERWPCQLAVSLHHANDEARSADMPVNRRYPLERLLAACRTYTERTHKVILFEYAVNPGLNDREEDADALENCLKGIPCRVNLIALNPLDGKSNGEAKERLLIFRDRLRERGFRVTLRPALGQDIDGACGQLRGKFLADIERSQI